MKLVYAVYSIANFGSDNDLWIHGYVNNKEAALSALKDYLRDEFDYKLNVENDKSLGSFEEFFIEDRNVKVGYELLKNLEES